MPTNPVEQTVSDWNGFVSKLQSLPEIDLACRGQGRSYLDPDPSIHHDSLTSQIDRCLPTMDLGKHLRIERAVCQRFREHAPVHLSSEEKRHLRTHWQQLVVMQHYGAPTRLLDWSKSPWIAAYFAVSTDWDHDGCVYVFQRDRLEQEIRTRFPTEIVHFVLGPTPTGEHFADPAWDLAENNEKLFERSTVSTLSKWVATFYCREAHFPRLSAQQGLFTFGSVPQLNHWNEICGLLNDGECWIFRIKKDQKLSILRRLNTMGLNGATLFPGADGIGRSLESFARTWHLDPAPSQM